VLCGIEDGNNFLCQADPNYFPSGTTVIAGIYGYMAATQQAGANSYGVVYCTEIVACKQALPVFQGFAKQLNLRYVSPVGASLAAADYTAQCLVMKNANATGLEPAGPPAKKFADDCARQSYHPIYSQGAGSWQNAYLQDPNLDGTTGDTEDVPWFYKGSQTAKFQAVEGKVLAATNYPYNVSTTYAAALLFATALAHAGSNPTAADVYSGLYAMHNETLGGYAPPLTFIKGKATIVPCYFPMRIKNGAFVATNGATPQCQPASASSS
jgi:branched-chain amino acid transport system substrate-binding protein